MGRARATRDLPGRVSEAEALWYDHARWPSFVEGFAHVAKLEGDWPRAGARLVWDSVPAGRGRVVETVTAYEARAGQVVEVEDEQLHGTQKVAFAPREDGCTITLELDYSLKRGGPLMAPVDVLFIRRSLRDSLRRTLAAFARELRAERELTSRSQPR